MIAAVALGLSQTGLFGRSSEECLPVKDLLNFSRSQAEHIAAKTGDAEGVPAAADEASYQVWADGLAERAQNVKSPDLARTATQVANLANQFTAKLPELRAQTNSRAPGAPAPPAAYEMATLNTQITDALAKLSDACPG